MFLKTDVIYQCDVCNRQIRLPKNKAGMEIMQRCIITENCLGKLRTTTTRVSTEYVPAIPPSVDGVPDWVQRSVLYIHKQTIESNEWTIQHDLRANPSVQVFVSRIDANGKSTLVEITPTRVVVIDLNTVRVELSRPESGLAQCIAYASQNTINPTFNVAPPPESDVVVTNRSEITIATRVDTPLINTTVRYINGAAVDVLYVNIDNVPSINSPWVNTSTVFVGGRTYYVRSFNVITTPTAPTFFALGQITNGSRMLFSDFPSTMRENLILLGKPPYGSVDRVYDQFIDIGAINQTSPELYFSNGEVFASPSVIRETYPPIFVVD